MIPADMQLKELTLANFQAHKERTIVLSPGITTLKGSSDSGKSAILRALRWVCLNDFSGEDFIRNGKKTAMIALAVKSKKSEDIITREKTRGGNHNAYTLNGQDYKSFGKSGVPSDIETALGMSELNFQAQHDAPFWFGLSAPEVSRQLNSVIDLSIIDTSLSSVASQLTSAREQEKLIRSRVDQASTRLEVLKKSEPMIEDFADLMLLKQEVEEKTEMQAALTRAIEGIRANKARQLAEEASELENLVKVAREGRGLLKRILTLSETIEQIEEYQKDAKMPPEMGPLKTIYSDLQRLDTTCDQLSRLITSIESKKEECEELLGVQRQTLKTFQDKTKNTICPHCGK